MHNLHRRFFLAVLSLVTIFLVPRTSRAGGEAIVTSDDDGKTPILATDNNDGLGNFSRFPFKVSATVRGGYDDNVNTVAMDKQGSGFENAAIGLSYDFGSPRTQISLQMGGGQTYYFSNRVGNGSGNQSADYNAYLSLLLKHKFNPRLTFDANVYLTYQVEPDFSLNVGLNRRSGNYFYTADKFTLTYLWTPRFSTATSYTFGATWYDDSAIGSYENHIENTIGNEFRFLVLPTTTVVAEYRMQFISYDSSLYGNSITYYALGGFDHTFNPRFNTSLRAGYQIRSYDTSANSINSGSSDSSPYFEWTFNYTAGKRTTVSWINRYGIVTSDVPGSPNETSFRTGLNLTHQWTPRISSNLGAFYEHDEYNGVSNFMIVSPAFGEDSFDLAVSVRYAISRYFGVDIGYNYTNVSSGIELRAYDRNRFYGGVDFTF